MLSRASLTEEELYRRALTVLLGRAKRARRNIVDFFDFVIREETTRAPVRCSPHQVVMFDFAMAHDRSVIMLPVGHSKTYGMATMGMYQLGIDNTLRGAFVSATQGQAAKPLGMVADYIEHSDELALVFPGLRPSLRQSDSWTQTAIKVDRPPGIRDASLIAVGIEGAIAGARLSWINVDDILNHENTLTKEGRNKTYDWFDSSVLSRLDPRGSRVTLTNTAWHPNDLLHRKRDEGWPTLRMTIDGEIEILNTDWDHPGIRPASPGSYLCRLVAHDEPVYDEQGIIPLWPERYPPNVIEKLRREHLPARFNQLFRNICRDDQSSRCKVEWIDRCKNNARQLGVNELCSSYHGNNMTFTGVDLAVSPGEENDDTCFFTFEVLPNGLRRILDIEVGKMDGPQIIEKLFRKVAAYKSVIRVENNAAQDYIRQFALKERIDLPIKPHTTGRVKAHPEHGIEGLFIEMFNGAWVIPCDSFGRVHPNVQRWIDACLYYSPSKHTDDTLMACYFAREQAKEWGVLTGSDTAGMNNGMGDLLAR